ncbi:hypothetical protein AFM12_04090 [Jiulongibacter sediminis]|uniref:Outer membrane protein beta-barrel domain-containing protein n=2 Tax=Jiulongibacter sediminis TaxID=1605367 RepID=A0A0P7BFW9_9BACT|nr:hypothetical protein AFM12_04090 [Jiulongibacter sediminis]TBX26802.1 hypothetical protein TK44_04095 [Jiulongibacter sediminis]
MSVSGWVNINNNGISLIPTFSLGKPSMLVDLSLKKKRLSFIPQFRYNLQDQKPWNFILWSRYRLIDQGKFTMQLGAFSSIVFKEQLVQLNGIDQYMVGTTRFLIGEIIPAYQLNQNSQISLYYMYTKGLAGASNYNLGSIQGTFNSLINFGKQRIDWSPKFYYLKVGDTPQQGSYFYSYLQISREGFPISVNTIQNIALKSTINASIFNWNVGLSYHL